MLTVDEQFDAIVNKMQPWQEPQPKEGEPSTEGEPKQAEKPEDK